MTSSAHRAGGVGRHAWALGLVLLAAGAPAAAWGQDAGPSSEATVVVLAPARAEWAAALTATLAARRAAVNWVALPETGLSGAPWESAVAALQRAVGESGAAAAVLALGEGDARELRGGEGPAIQWGAPAWTEEYQRRVITLVEAAGVPCLVLGPRSHPHSNTNLRAAALGLWIRQSARHAGARFADAFSLTADVYGAYALSVSMPGEGGAAEEAHRERASGRLRPGGAERLARWIERELDAL